MLIYETIYGDWIFLEIRRILEHAEIDLVRSLQHDDASEMLRQQAAKNIDCTWYDSYHLNAEKCVYIHTFWNWFELELPV